MKHLLLILALTACTPRPQYSRADVYDICKENSPTATFEQCTMLTFNYCADYGC